MSYIRFGELDSQVYVIPTEDGLECCGCILGAACYKSRSMREFVQHLLTHEDAGHVVPPSVYWSLREAEVWLLCNGITHH